MSQFHRNAAQVIEEIAETVRRVKTPQVSSAISAILTARKVFVLGVGREGLAARGFAMRLSHLGLVVHWGWDDTTPAVTDKDVLVLVTGSGAIGHLDYVFKQVQSVGASTVVITAVPEAKTPMAADTTLVVPAMAFRSHGDLVSSMQPMGSLFEQSVQVVFDLIVLEAMYKLGLDPDDLVLRHRNFE